MGTGKLNGFFFFLDLNVSDIASSVKYLAKRTGLKQDRICSIPNSFP